MSKQQPKPVRMQRSRAKGSRLVSPNGLPVVCVTRPGKWGNPFYSPGLSVADSVALCRKWLAGAIEESVVLRMPNGEHIEAPERPDISELRGKNLACWCKLCPKHAATGKPFDERCADCDPCHSDVQLELANKD